MDDDDLRRALDAHFEREIGRPPTGVRDRGLAGLRAAPPHSHRSEEHTSELQSQSNLVCRLLLEKKKKPDMTYRLFCPSDIGSAPRQQAELPLHQSCQLHRMDRHLLPPRSVSCINSQPTAAPVRV